MEDRKVNIQNGRYTRVSNGKSAKWPESAHAEHHSLSAVLYFCPIKMIKLEAFVDSSIAHKECGKNKWKIIREASTFSSTNGQPNQTGHDIVAILSFPVSKQK